MTLLPCRTWRCTTSSPSATPWSSSGESTGWRGRKPRHAWIFSSTSCIYLRRTVWSEISGWTPVLTLLRDGRVTSVSPYDRGFTALGRPLTLMHGINVHRRLLECYDFALKRGKGRSNKGRSNAAQFGRWICSFGKHNSVLLCHILKWGPSSFCSSPNPSILSVQVCNILCLQPLAWKHMFLICSGFYNPAEQTILSTRPCLFDQLCVYCLQFILQSFSCLDTNEDISSCYLCSYWRKS